MSDSLTTALTLWRKALDEELASLGERPASNVAVYYYHSGGYSPRDAATTIIMNRATDPTVTGETQCPILTT